MPSKNVMPKYKAGKLHSGSKHGPIVTDKKQAVAIMISEHKDEMYGKEERRKPSRKKS